jgi:lipopolysaccharide biosynthesis glycosyltransferase
MGSAYSDAYIKIAHISTATYYRLKLPSILPDINKCIYLDVDLIARKDLSEMFRINVDDNYIAGVKAAGYYQTKEQMEKKKVQLGIEAIDSYVNAGVLIMNLAKMRKDGIEENFEKALENKWPSQDQDVLNAICYGKIRIIHMKYNAMTKYELDNDNAYKNIKYLKRVYSKGEWDSGRKNPTIIHFCDKTKPWTSVQAVYSYLWWDVVRHLPDDISLAIYDRYMDEIIRKATVLNKEVKHERSKKLGIQKKCDLLLEENKVLKSNIVKLKKQNQQTKKSITFRIGSIFTFIPHKLKRLFKK